MKKLILTAIALLAISFANAGVKPELNVIAPDDGTITAEETKHMFGAKRIKQVGFGILKDNYNAILLDSMEE